MLHTIFELKEHFVRRDEGHTTRNEKDSAARNWFWVLAAQKFNDESFLPVLMQTPDYSINLIFEGAHLDPTSTRYKGALHPLTTPPHAPCTQRE